MKYTKEQKQEYFKALRNRWKSSKLLAENDQEAKALWQETGGKVSYYSFYFTLIDMKRLGYGGLPYIDCKTFNGWKESGFKVKKGEHSKINGLVWLSREDEEGDPDEKRIVYPKSYHLFHKTQVEVLK